MEDVIDDGIEDVYIERLEELRSQREKRSSLRNSAENHQDTDDRDWRETFYAREAEDDVYGKNGLQIPAYVHHNLHSYQREGLQWLWDLHERNTGGIIGDEMGLGKTVQTVAYFACIRKMYVLNRALLVCPGSVLFHWVREFHKWCPDLRVIVLHRAGTALSVMSHQEIISSVADKGGVIILTYEALRQHQELVLSIPWDYAVLDEGHKIRNPDADITLACKQIRTAHRIILTGTPIQNRLRELWSLFDFVFPGRLGTLPTFEDEFVLPIRQGAYTNASKMQIYMAYKCARMLQDLIKPFLLRRTKKELHFETQLPGKTEQILFCNLSPKQREAYETYLGSSEMNLVLNQEIKPFRAIGVLRKICNHADLIQVSRGKQLQYEQIVTKSGKMAVLDSILPEWFANGHRVLLFSQTRHMLDIIQMYIRHKNWQHCRLDGETPMRDRQTMIDQFNDPNSGIFVFLLTTRAGGIGINLSGADRVIIFDPDWNPSTDVQARERAWRLGQQKSVTIYRLITCGTIEEKIYHRQVFKQYITDKVLKDPKRRRKFTRTNLSDLFSLNDSTEDDTTGTETGDLFLAGHIAPDGQSPNSEGEEDKPSSASVILQKLFEGGDIRSVFSHDALEADTISNQEATLVDLEAKKVATEAVRTIRRSASAVREGREGVHIPTWTGRSGTAGVRPSSAASTRPALNLNGKRSSSGTATGSRSLLDKIRKKEAPKLDTTPRSKRFRILSPHEMAKEVLDYFKQQPHQRATTKQVLHAFDAIVTSENKLTFREVLRKMATCKNQVWSLKSD